MNFRYEIVNQQNNVEVFGIKLEKLVEAMLISDGVRLHSLIAIHDTTLGPSLGGLRFCSYKDFGERGEELGLNFKSQRDYAMWDVTRLARGMTYKAAIHNLNLGGGKAVIIGNPDKDKSEGLFRTFGSLVNSLEGNYITAEDSGTNKEDMELIAQETPYVVGLDRYNDFIGSGDPGPFTAYGLSKAIEASILPHLLNKKLSNLVIGVQGIGSVGFPLVFGFPDDEKFDSKRIKKFTPLIESCKQVIISDTDQKKITKAEERAIDLGLYSKLQVIDSQIFLAREMDIYAPCLREGAILNGESINLLSKNGCKIIAGATNHQLATEKYGKVLHSLRIRYITDFVGNGGGLINVYMEWLARQKGEDYDISLAVDRVSDIFYTVEDLLERSTVENKPTNIIANQIAEERIASARKAKSQKVTAQ